MSKFTNIGSAVRFLLSAGFLAVGCLAINGAALAATGPSVTVTGKQDAATGKWTFSGDVIVGTPAWTASGVTSVTIVPFPSGPAVPNVIGQVNVTQTGWTSDYPTAPPGNLPVLPKGTYNVFVSLKFTKAGQQAQTMTATTQIIVP